MDVAEAGGGHVAVAPALGPAAPGEVRIFVVHEEPLIEQADVLEVGGPEQHAGAAPREHVGHRLVLTGIALEEATVAAVARTGQVRAHVVDDVVAVRLELHVDPPRDGSDRH